MMTKHQSHMSSTASHMPRTSKMSTCVTITGVSSSRKRTHLKPSQLMILQESFSRNPLPDSNTRSQLAKQLNVTERTIQIWFQNRRAKARKMDRFSTPDQSNVSSESSRWMESGRIPQQARYQPTFRTMMTPELFEELRQQQEPPVRRRLHSNSKLDDPKDLLSPELYSQTISEGTKHFRASPHVQEPVSQSTLPLHAQMLRIGTWSRFASSSVMGHRSDAWDLSCHGNLVDRQLVWEIETAGHRFRVLVPFDAVCEIQLGPAFTGDTGTLQTTVEFVLYPQYLKHLAFKMQRPSSDHSWMRCGDFSEDKQASQVYAHVLQGREEPLRQSLFDLVAHAPDLASKVSVLPTSSENMLPPVLDLCRDLTHSPSVTPTPEPFLPQSIVSLPSHIGFDSFSLDNTFTKPSPLTFPAQVDNSFPMMGIHNSQTGPQMLLAQYPSVQCETQHII